MIPTAELLALTGRRALVTGATGTIGGAIARRLAEAGAEVVVHGSPASGDRAEALAAELDPPG
ncbi:MAG TPA: SDR family NAD(P)-dependent oxidoreductase, partial [Actinobacteria bacterium]|nr:SDR family NAD(P)-dependent oxidoreductase [Actinomycetota bacterium]